MIRIGRNIDLTKVKFGLNSTRLRSDDNICDLVAFGYYC